MPITENITEGRSIIDFLLLLCGFGFFLWLRTTLSLSSNQWLWIKRQLFTKRRWKGKLRIGRESNYNKHFLRSFQALYNESGLYVACRNVWAFISLGNCKPVDEIQRLAHGSELQIGRIFLEGISSMYCNEVRPRFGIFKKSFCAVGYIDYIIRSRRMELFAYGIKRLLELWGVFIDVGDIRWLFSVESSSLRFEGKETWQFQYVCPNSISRVCNIVSLWHRRVVCQQPGRSTWVQLQERHRLLDGHRSWNKTRSSSQLWSEWWVLRSTPFHSFSLAGCNASVKLPQSSCT